MKLIDSTQQLVLSAQEVCSLGADKISNTANFSTYIKGIHLDPEILFSPRWNNSQHDPKSMFDYIVLEMIPAFYNYSYLEEIGEFSFTIRGVANYSIIPINNRVVAMQNGILNAMTGEEKIDFIIDPVIFIAFCRSLMLETSKKFLEQDNEWEDTEISLKELDNFGMPAGGCLPPVDPDIYNPSTGSSTSGSGVSDSSSSTIYFDSENNLYVYGTGEDQFILGLNTGDIMHNGGFDTEGIQVEEPMQLGALSPVHSDSLVEIEITGSDSVCGVYFGACATNSTIIPGLCVENLSICAAKSGGATACAQNASVCTTNAGFGSACGSNAGACGTKLGSITACGANYGACGLKTTGASACGGKVGACGADVGYGSACGANATACAAKIKPGSTCGAKAGACGVDIGDLCPANAGICGVNFPGDIVSACLINIIPGLPSC